MKELILHITPKFLREIALEELSRPFDWYCTATLTAEIIAMSFWSMLYTEFSMGWLVHLIGGIVSGVLVYIFSRTLGRWAVIKIENRFTWLKCKDDERKP
jgi:membrane associated rhomboid family serine protease